MHHIPRYVRDRHALYARTGMHAERPLQRLMVELGHPLAAEYLEFWRLYDALPYASCAGYRIYACRSETEIAECCVPTLYVDATATPAEDKLHALARAAWPADHHYQLDPGKWYVRTADSRFLMSLCSTPGIRVIPMSGASATFQTTCQTAWIAMRAKIEAYFGHSILHPGRVQEAVAATQVQHLGLLEQISNDLAVIRAPSVWL